MAHRLLPWGAVPHSDIRSVLRTVLDDRRRAKPGEPPQQEDSFVHASPQYQIVLHLGPAPQISALRIVDVTPAMPETGQGVADAVVQALARAGLGPEDFRARILLAVDGTDPMTAVLAYAAAVGLTGRFVDALVEGRVVPLARLAEQRSALADAGRPGETVEALEADDTEDGPLADLVSAGPDPRTVSMFRYAWHVRLTVSGGPAVALVHFVTVASVRRRGTAERFPQLAPNTRAAAGPDVEHDPDLDVDAEALRRAGAALRRAHRLDNRREIVAPTEPTARMLRLRAAAVVPVAGVMLRLGSVLDEAGERWRCPRPQRHTNGDSNPSMVQRDDNMVRCGRCDIEPVDPLRLVMDALGMSVDEAAAWISSGAARPVAGGT